MAIPGTSTGQRSTGRPVVFTAGSCGNFMVWTGTTAAANPNTNWVNFANVASGYSFPQAPVTSFSSNHGPAFVLMPSGVQAYVAWTDAATSQVMYTTATLANGAWSLQSPATAIPNSNAASGPEAVVGLQDNQLVLGLLWMDNGAKALVGCQVLIGSSTPNLNFASLGVACVDRPDMVQAGGQTFLAFFDTSNNFNLVIDPNGGVAFNMTTRQTFSGINSSYGPSFVPLSGKTQAYLFWTSGTGGTATLQYQQMGLAQNGTWAFNSTAGCQGSVTGATPSAAPYGQLIETVDGNGVTQMQFLVAWPDINGSPINLVYTDTVTPNYAPIPI